VTLSTDAALICPRCSAATVTKWSAVPWCPSCEWNLARFDPDARWRATALLVTLLIAWPLLVWSRFDPAALFDPRNFPAMARFLSGFIPPETAPVCAKAAPNT